MKASQLRQLIKEEISKVLNENELPDLRVGDYVKVRTKSGEVMGIVTTVNRDGYFYQQVKNVGDAANPYNRGGMVDGTNFIAKMNKTINEKLKGKQVKLDANKNGKIDAEDFKLLKTKK